MRWLGLLMLVLLAGCAKLPPGGGASGGKRLILQMTFDAEVRENFVYIIPLRVSTILDPTDDGPLPVIAPPWGNGFVSGNATHFIMWEPARPHPFVLYRFNDPSLLSWTEIGLIENYDVIPIDDPNIEQPERKTIRFEVEVNSLADTPAQAALLQSVQINFLSMERIGSGTQTRAFDALGNQALTEFLFGEFPLGSANIYRNGNPTELEPPLNADTTDPSLDLRDWLVEVRLN